jgi:hypothetical protein
MGTLRDSAVHRGMDTKMKGSRGKFTKAEIFYCKG